MKGTHEVSCIRNRNIDPEMESNDSTLSEICSQFGYRVKSTQLGVDCFDRIQVKYFLAKSSSRAHKYMVGFLFDVQATGKLVRIKHDDVNKLSSFISETLLINEEFTAILVGKKGSRKDNRFTFKCVPYEPGNLLIREFTSQDNIQAYISVILSDIDKIESKRAKDLVRADMAVIQTSEKCLKIPSGLDRMKVQELVFANQLLQVPGVTEKLAIALSLRFQNTAGLMNHMNSGQSLKDFTFPDSRQATKKINNRLVSVLERIFDSKTDPNLCIW